MSATTYYNDIDSFACAVLRKQVRAGNLPLGDIDERDITTVLASELLGYTHAHLFAGFGGFALGFLRAGVSHALRILTGGFPCQDISCAGKQAGLAGERSGLWSHMLRIVRDSAEAGRPFDYVVIENVRNLLSGKSDETVCDSAQWDLACAVPQTWMATILKDLASIGYDACWRVLRACDFGAPHIRARIIVVAYPGSDRRRQWAHQQERQPWSVGQADARHDGTQEYVAYSQSQGRSAGGARGWQAEACQPIYLQSANDGNPLAHASSSRWQEWDFATIAGDQGHASWRNLAPGSAERLVEDSTSRREWQHQITGGTTRTQSLSEQSGTRNLEPGMGRATDGLSSWLERYQWPGLPGQAQYEWESPRVTDKKVLNRTHRLKGLGNAIVPQLAEYIGRCIMAAEAEKRGAA